jgi:hypothetical protein
VSPAPYNIFISHYGEDRPIAQAVRDVLGEAYSGFASAFISSDIAPGNDWLRAVKESLNGSDEMTGKVVTPVLFKGYAKENLSVIYEVMQAVDSRSESDVAGLYDGILARVRKNFPTARPGLKDQKAFWAAWNDRVLRAEALSPETPRRWGERPVVWLMGSHRHLETERERQKALQVCQALARAFVTARFHVVMGASRMLEYLGDQYVNYLENPQQLADAEGDSWRKTLAAEHAQGARPAPNPVVLLGPLTQSSLRETFNDAIGRFPDIAILIGGRLPEQSGRAAEEFQRAVQAGIPVLPIQFTGGAARTVEPTTHPSLKDKVAELQTLVGNVGRIGPLVVEIVETQAAHQRAQYPPRGLCQDSAVEERHRPA